jgi:replication-associated recombination protein RarA
MMKVERKKDRVMVESESTPGFWYEVSLDPPSCTCPDFHKRQRPCKHVRAAKGERDPKVTKGGYPVDEIISFMQKAVRRGMEADAAWTVIELVESGLTRYALRRLAICASEDIGPADPLATLTVLAIKAEIEKQMEAGPRWMGPPMEMLGTLILTLCRARKSRQGDDLMWLVKNRRKKGWAPGIPGWARDEHTESGRQTLKEEAVRQKVSFEEMKKRKFYEEGGLLRGGAAQLKGTNWSKVLFEEVLHLPWTGYVLPEDEP